MSPPAHTDTELHNSHRLTFDSLSVSVLSDIHTSQPAIQTHVYLVCRDFTYIPCICSVSPHLAVLHHSSRFYESRGSRTSV